MRKIINAIAAFILMASNTIVAFAGEIAITLDDLPYVLPSRTTPQEGQAIVVAINQALAAHGIKATGFVVGRQITEQSRPALAAFAAAGHTIGNHSWSHPDYGTLSINEFRAEVSRTDAVLTEWIHAARFYRFPYLREGETEQAKADADAVLTGLGYVNVPVTIDNDEWRFNADYLDALAAGDDEAAQLIAAQYIAHMQERTMHFQALAHTAMGRDVKHILLLHMNQINADHLGELLDWYATTGWRFITVDEAMMDPIYTAPDLYAGARGLSQIERVMGRKSE
ncbi:polysaccharide deacetylase [Yoonia maricola]|uniref:Chitooligosaccharide deacetylase n=1 Tax=Yoonia maricola TaxID=420999 RepID=A0A2M8W241_9RHOB|nr:polysaccharide deacetylase family protein [Yoonia maricola]PJI84986.1 polysaccharide deacetylase [Yoonia maricola]